MAVPGLLQSFYIVTIWIWKSDKKEHENWEHFETVQLLTSTNIVYSRFSKIWTLCITQESLIVFIFVLFKNCAFVVHNAVM